MADSSLVVSGGNGGGGGFAQQGSVDWVALSGSTLSFSIDVLSRFSKAGVEMVTVAMGQALFAKFNIRHDGQKRFSDAISRLKAVSSYGKILWFGFGVKHIIRTLSETEQGIACASICACLSVSFDDLYSSKVLKAMADIQKAPVALKPSLSQWSSLLSICAGGVTHSTFPCIVQGITRVLSPSSGMQDCFLHSPTPPESLAGALLELAKVSNGTLISVTFVGGVDCGWLAAVAQWLLSLRVQIIDVDGTVLYETQGTSENDYPQVIVRRHSEANPHGTAVMSRSFVVPPGTLFFSLQNFSFRERPREHIISRGRSEWSLILHDTFGSVLDTILEPANVLKTTRFLGFCLDSSPEQQDISSLNPWSNTFPTRFESLRKWLNFAAWRLPELAPLAHVASFNEHALNFEGDGSTIHLDILEICRCDPCRLELSNNALPHWKIAGEICLMRVCFTIAEFVWTLSWLDIDDAVLPSADGLRILYLNRGRYLLPSSFDASSGKKSLAVSTDIIRRTIWERPIASIVFPLFTGLNVSSNAFHETETARSNGGLCMFLPSLIDPTASPSHQLRVNLVPGHIQKDDALFEIVSDLKDSAAMFDSDIPFSKYVQDFGASPKLSLMIEETLASNALEAYFWVRTNNNREAPFQNPMLTAFGASTIRSLLARRIEIEPCGKHEVTIQPPVPALSILALWTSSWTGLCCAAGEALWTADISKATLHPAPDEWVLTLPRVSSTGEMEVLRGSFSLIYTILCQRKASFRMRMTIISCLPCFYLHKKSRYTGGILVISMNENPPWQLKIAESIEKVVDNI